MNQTPISDLRRRMLEDMAVRRLGEKTQHDYIKHVETFTIFLGRSPDTATAEDLRRFQVHETRQGSKPPKMNILSRTIGPPTVAPLNSSFARGGFFVPEVMAVLVRLFRTELFSLP